MTERRSSQASQALRFPAHQPHSLIERTMSYKLDSIIYHAAHYGLTLLLLCFCARPSLADELVPADPQPRWWKGNLHTHSLWSDGDDFPEMIAEWYRTHGYHFLALSDHNVMSEGQRWMSLKEVNSRGGAECLDKYLGRFGAAWVELRNQSADGSGEVRLKPLNEFRALIETRGTFIMMTGEEISDSSQGKPVHMNATNLRDLIEPLGGETVVAAARANLRAAEYQAKQLGREILVHLNHPNFGYAFTAEELAEVLEEQFFEVYNGHPAVNHEGDAKHLGTERMWDVANTLRLTTLATPPLLGVATDDSHDYHDGTKGATSGRGWVMVRSTHLTPEFLIRAMKQGHFYASSGVELEHVHFEPSTKRLTIKIRPQAGVTFATQFIGTRYTTVDGERKVAPNQLGVELAKQAGTEAEYQLSGDELFVRAVVTSDKAHPNPSLKNQKQQVWTQPVGWSLSE